MLLCLNEKKMVPRGPIRYHMTTKNSFAQPAPASVHRVDVSCCAKSSAALAFAHDEAVIQKKHSLVVRRQLANTIIIARFHVKYGGILDP
jgi:hypothetical protein